MTLFRPAIERMLGYQPGEQPQSGKFIKLNTNENPYPPSPAVISAITGAFEHGLRRYPDPLCTAFRLEAARLLDVDPEWILCGNGSDDLLTIVTRTFVGEGQKIRMPHPSYVLYPTLAHIQGAVSDPVRFTDHWSLPEAFARPASDVRLAFLANPNSPSGTVIPPETVLQMVTQLECPLLVDEAYVEFADTDCLSLVKQHERIIVSRSLSKSYALAGLRFGYLVAQPHVIEQLRKVKDSYNCDALAIAGATAAINDQDWLAKTRARIVRTRTRLEQTLTEAGFSVQPSQANFVWCHHPEEPAKSIYEQLKSRRILVRYMNYADWGDGLRITVGTDEQADALRSVLSSILEPK